ncbi:division/cell wall cluster transcriptional repressor MraZ [Desulfovibrio sp. OttesenSCG-928-C14]|nr:division/cell wall cluster transcriptional repressor MraZ [Desulfovibrio sp. OttesenSCG-928-C14]
MLFRGRVSRSLDAKGRLVLPPDFREILLARSEDGQMVLTTYDNCVVGFPYPDWLRFEASLNKISHPKAPVRNFRRVVIGGAEIMKTDAQGRVRLSRDHLDYAGINGEAVLMGQGPRFEIWQPARLSSILAASYEDVADYLEPDVELVF